MKMVLFQSDRNLEKGNDRTLPPGLFSLSSILFFIFLFTARADFLYSQSSENYTIGESAFNSGGNPSPILTSTNYTITLGSIGEGVAGFGMESASYGMETGFPTPYPPPGEVQNLHFTDRITLTWNAERSANGYYLYRGDLVDLPSNYGIRIEPPVTETHTTDEETPDPGDSFFYLLTAVNRIGEEGSKGSDSLGTPRP